jgi:hypothetical protein
MVEPSEEEKAKQLLERLADAVLPIYAIGKDAVWHPVGSCFVVSVLNSKRAFALTAAHNLRHALACLSGERRTSHATTPDEFRQPASHRFELTEPEEILAVIPGDLKTGGLAKLARAWWTEASDIAFVLLEIGEQYPATFRASLAIDSRSVKEADQVVALGHAKLSVSSSQNYEAEEYLASLQLGLQHRVGSVLELRPHGGTIYRWPGFLVDCPFDSGMSGGPVITMANDELCVRGVVCGDLSTDAANGALGSGAQAFAGGDLHPFGGRANFQHWPHHPESLCA